MLKEVTSSFSSCVQPQYMKLDHIGDFHKETTMMTVPATLLMCDELCWCVIMEEFLCESEEKDADEGDEEEERIVERWRICWDQVEI